MVQKRWKVIREKFSVAYRKVYIDGASTGWALYDSCLFLMPYVNLKNEVKKDEGEEAVPEVAKQILPKSSFDENTLTQLVRNRPVLYDKRHEDFRVSNIRKKAWLEISAISGWDVGTLQKRWRVMRDRFVRELRRTKNIESDAQINCSAFFRDMLFLVRHVKSKKYEAETADVTPDSSRDNWEHQELQEDDEADQLETCLIPEPDGALVIENSEQVVTYAIDDSSEQFAHCFETAEAVEQVTYDENCSAVDDFYEEEEEEEEVFEQPAEENFVDEPEAVEEIQEEAWFKPDDRSPKKRHHSGESLESSPAKRRSESILPSSSAQKRQRLSEPEEPADENTSFCQMIGFMLKKLPPHLTASARLKVLQVLTDFEMQHKLS